MKRFFRILRRWTLLAVIILGIYHGAKYIHQVFFSYTYDSTISEMTDDELSVNVKPESGVVNIALFGIDTRPDEPTRSDSMMVLSLDCNSGDIKLISLMRDSKVEIDGHGTQKLCHAYSYGQAALAIKTINECFNLDITDYAAVNFVQMANLIGEIGGVELYVSEDERVEANKYIKEYYESFDMQPELIKNSGYQRLNGIQAMTFARIRKGGTGDDWGRVNRQGMVMEAMFTEIKNKSIPELVAMIPRLMPYITTSLEKTEMISLIKGAFSNGVPQISHYRVPEDGKWSYGGKNDEYIVYDIETAANTIQNIIY